MPPQLNALLLLLITSGGTDFPSPDQYTNNPVHSLNQDLVSPEENILNSKEKPEVGKEVYDQTFPCTKHPSGFLKKNVGYQPIYEDVKYQDNFQTNNPEINYVYQYFGLTVGRLFMDIQQHNAMIPPSNYNMHHQSRLGRSSKTHLAAGQGNRERFLDKEDNEEGNSLNSSLSTRTTDKTTQNTSSRNIDIHGRLYDWSKKSNSKKKGKSSYHDMNSLNLKTSRNIVKTETVNTNYSEIINTPKIISSDRENDSFALHAPTGLQSHGFTTEENDAMENTPTVIYNSKLNGTVDRKLSPKHIEHAKNNELRTHSIRNVNNPAKFTKVPMWHSISRDKNSESDYELQKRKELSVKRVAGIQYDNLTKHKYLMKNAAVLLNQEGSISSQKDAIISKLVNNAKNNINDNILVSRIGGVNDMRTETNIEKKERKIKKEAGKVPTIRTKREVWLLRYKENPQKNHIFINRTKVQSAQILNRGNPKIVRRIYRSYIPLKLNKHSAENLDSYDSHKPITSTHDTQVGNSNKHALRSFTLIGPNVNQSLAYRSSSKFDMDVLDKRLAIRTQVVNTRTREETTFAKTPQQRHARSRHRSKRKVAAREVWAVRGDLTLLPCDLTSEQPGDSLQMVMWLREGTHTPLFSVDYRQQGGGGGRVWRDNSASTAIRAHLRLAGGDVGKEDGATLHENLRPGVKEKNLENEGVGSESGLMVRDVERNDSAIYRCRVDFLLSPTRNTRVNLTVVVPPVSVSVRWWRGNSGNTATNGKVGPFREGDAPTLVCITTNAWPSPRLVWFEEDTMVDDTSARERGNQEQEGGSVENTLALVPLTRSHHHTRFTCIATNTNLTRPVAETVRINMILDVVSVVVEAVGTQSAGAQAEVKCTVLGSNPPPVISWSLAGITLPATKPWVSNDGNRSVSMVHFVPQSSHDGEELMCSAHNPAIARDTAQHNPPRTHRHSTHIIVNYPPQAAVSLGRSLDANNIKEGDDLYFECSTVAKPFPHKVAWKHNNKDLASGPGVLVSNMTLVLQEVDRHNAGIYSCIATNTEGFSESPPLKLDIKFAPVCATQEVSQHSVAKHENARISCNVLANPPVVEFNWSFNNTAEAVKVPEDRYVMKGTESVVNYTPVTELDYGTLLCWANNNIGRQIQPCVFQIVAAGKPDPAHNCRAYDVTISSLRVSCLPGDDGGLAQTFTLHVIERQGEVHPVVEVTRDDPTFSVANLRPATAYRLVIKSRNLKGESTPTELSAYTVALNHPQHETAAEPTRGRESGSEATFGVIVGVALTCLTVVAVVVGVGVRSCLRARACRRARADNDEKEKGGKVTDASYGDVLVAGEGQDTTTNITTITSSTSGKSPAPPINSQVSQMGPGLVYPAAGIYSPSRIQGVVTQILPSNPLCTEPYNVEKASEGGKRLVAMAIPPPAAYNQGYHVTYHSSQALDRTYQPSESSRIGPGYPVISPVHPGSHLPASSYPIMDSSVGNTNFQCISSDPLNPSSNLELGTINPKSSSGYGTLSHTNVLETSSLSTLPVGKESYKDAKMSTLYNPLKLLTNSSLQFRSLSDQQKSVLEQHSAQGHNFGLDAERVLNTGSLKRGARLGQRHEVHKIRDDGRSRSASFSSVISKKESSV